MTVATEKLLEDVLALPEDERFEFSEAVQASLMANEPLSEYWKAEVARRLAELESGTVKTYTWEEVKRQAREGRLD